MEAEGARRTPTPFTIVTITYKVAVYAPAETLTLSFIFHMYSVINTNITKQISALYTSSIFEIQAEL